MITLSTRAAITAKLRWWEALRMENIETRLTSSSITIKADDPKGGKPHCYFYSPSHIPTGELHFIKKVKNHAKTLPEYTPEMLALTGDLPYTPRQINYFKLYRPAIPETFTDVVEIDINGAYWHTANKLGLLDPETYKQGNGEHLIGLTDEDYHELRKRGEIAPAIGKITRLASLGALAAKVDVFGCQYNPLRYERKGAPVHNPVTANYFYTIAAYLDQIMDGAGKFLLDDILFYWVDAFFVRKRSADKLLEYINASGFTAKLKPLDGIEIGFSKKYNCWTIDVQETAKPKPKTFFYDGSTRENILSNFLV